MFCTNGNKVQRVVTAELIRKTTNGFVASTRGAEYANNNMNLLISPKGGLEFELVFAITKPWLVKLCSFACHY